MENVLLALIGMLCIHIGISNRKGDISLLHSYHRKRVTEEDRLPFGKKVGLGMITVGVTMILTGCLFFIARHLQNGVYSTIGNVVLIVGLVLGLGISFYAILKYNKGIF